MTYWETTMAERNRHMAEMYAAGMNLREIGYEFMITTASVWGVLRRSGIPLRPQNSPVRWAVPS